jgi:prepilin-type N-terminal cleavage/methylation domain-containing protein/prepilin-type processing-associated H-X9-DG protein
MNRVHPASRARRVRVGFTLVELLVVIGIIALLISILLPSLSKARKAASTVKCLANIRSICQGMIMYAAQNRDYFPGGPTSSGRFLFNSDWSANPAFSNTNCPDISQIWDWQAPIADVMGIDFNHGGATTDRVERFVHLRDFKGFTCPENETIGVPFGTPTFPVGKLVSYNTGDEFFLAPFDPNSKGFVGTTQSGPTGLVIPPGYAPMVSKVGRAARKVYIADGARFSNTTNPPDTSLSYTGSGGGAYSSLGAFNAKDNGWNRSLAPGNGGSGTIDARIYAFRHGGNAFGGAANSYRINVGFFDGHAETLGDLEASDPNFWLPKDTVYDTGGNFPLCKDAATSFGLAGTITID